MSRARLTLSLLVVLMLPACTSYGVLAPEASPTTSPKAVPKPLPTFPPGIQGVPTSQRCREELHLLCYVPAQLQRAYDLDPLYARGLDGSGVTIALVVWFGSPTIRADLAHFDSVFHLRAPPSFRIIEPQGPVQPFNPRSRGRVDWARETTLDVEWAHAMAPGANLLLVESPGLDDRASGLQHIIAAQDYVIQHHLADVISESWGESEAEVAGLQIGPLHKVLREARAEHITVVFSSGDEGSAGDGGGPGDFFTLPVVSWPASDPLVTAVGGLQLHLDASGRRIHPDSVWNETFDRRLLRVVPSPTASGGGRSARFRRPAYQNSVADVVGRTRGIPDISLSAAGEGGAAVYHTFQGAGRGFFVGWGTSEAAPQFAGIVAIADQAAGHPLGFIDPLLYRSATDHSPGIVDVTRGGNGVAYRAFHRVSWIRGWEATAGYDLASGLGTVDAAKLVDELSHG